MKNLKPSQLPEGTVIDDEKQGEYIKRADNVWEELDMDYMGDRQRVSDEGYTNYWDAGASTRNLTWRAKSDEYFTEYKIIAVPPGFVFVGDAESIHGKWYQIVGSYEDGSRPHECRGYNCEG